MIALAGKRPPNRVNLRGSVRENAPRPVEHSGERPLVGMITAGSFMGLSTERFPLTTFGALCSRNRLDTPRSGTPCRSTLGQNSP